MGTEPGEAGDGLAQGQIFHSLRTLGPDVIQARLGGGSGVGVLHIDGGGANDGVAVDGGSHQNALALFAGELENGALHEAARGAVQEEVVAPAGDDGHGIVRDHVVEPAGVNACGVDHDSGLQVASDGPDPPAALDFLDVGDLGVELELHAVAGGVLCQGVCQAEGTDNAAGGGIEGGDGPVGDVGLQGCQLLPLDDAQALHAVFDAVLVEPDQVGTVSLVQHDHERAVLAVVEVQLLAQGGHHLAPEDVELCHEGAVLGVVACVDDGGVGLGGAAADILRPLHHEDGCVLPGELPGNGTAANACADDDDIGQDASLLWGNGDSVHKEGSPPPGNSGEGAEKSDYFRAF